jgi:hypothetical protein
MKKLSELEARGQAILKDTEAGFIYILPADIIKILSKGSPADSEPKGGRL